MYCSVSLVLFCFKQKTAYEMRISDWSSDVCSSDLSWIDAEVTRNPLNPALVGNKFPRVPKWRANASVRYSPSEDWSLAANFRHQSTPDRNNENNSTSLCDTFYCVSTFSFVRSEEQHV